MLGSAPGRDHAIATNIDLELLAELNEGRQ